jgi:hypothetical protein
VFLRGDPAGICMWASARPACTSSQTTLIRPVHRRLESPSVLHYLYAREAEAGARTIFWAATQDTNLGLAKLHRSVPGSRVCSLSLSLSKLIKWYSRGLCE